MSDITEVYKLAAENPTTGVFMFCQAYYSAVNASHEKKGLALLTTEEQAVVYNNINKLLGLRNYNLPVVSIDRTASEEDVAEIFVRVNSGGQKLLEKNFIEERICKDKQFEQAENMDAACEHIDERLTPFYPQFVREVTKEDILKLMEIKMARILKFNKDKADEFITKLKADIEEIDNHLAHITEYTIDWYTRIKEKYGKNFPRRTEIRNFDTIVATKVAEANEKLYINREEGFIGTGLKKDEYICNCSDIDDVIIFYKDGKYKIVRVSDKLFVGKNILYVNIFKKNDKRTIYNVIYRDGKEGFHYIKRFNVTSMIRDREYDVTQGTPGSKIVYFTANPNGEAEVIKVTLRPNPRIKKLIFEKDFSTINIKGRQSMGNLLTKYEVHKISLKQRGGSTLGGRKVWFDHDVLRLNYDGRGQYLGEFQSGESILVVHKNGEFYTTDFDLNNHYDADIQFIEKFDAEKVWTAVLYDADQQNYPYLKRFTFEQTAKRLNYLGENKHNQLILLSGEVYPRLQVVFGGHDSFREALIIEASDFVGVKSFKAKGKRLTTFTVDRIEELEPTRRPEPQEDMEDADTPETENDNVAEEDNEQMTLF